MIVVVAIVATVGVVSLVSGWERQVGSPTRDQLAKERDSEQAAPSALADEIVIRDPIVALPDGASACGASDIEFNRGADMGLGFLMFFNRGGRACGLLDYPTLQGRDEDGVWRNIPTVRSFGSSYTDGPGWTGSFDPRYTAVLSIRPQGADPELGRCRGGAGAAKTFSDLRLMLAGRRDTISLADVVFDLGECKPRILLWAYDSTDI